jgi:hypothetical protein
VNIFKLALFQFILLNGFGLLQADPAPVLPPGVVDPLTEALPILRTGYVDFKDLHYKPGDSLKNLIARSGGKIDLVGPAPASPPLPIIPAWLPGGVIYWRLASFTLPPGKGWPDFTADLQRGGEAAPGIILDLRCNMTPDDYAGAVQVRSFFGPAYVINAPRSNMTPDQAPVTQLFPGPRIVLVNHQTTGAAEALAGFLQADGALVVGRPTAGKVAVFQEYKLSSGQVLRYAASPPAHQDPARLFRFRSESPAWGRPVLPDISVAVDDRVEEAALTLIKDHHILDVISESPERHRLSEASLVQGQDPEWDGYLASLEQRPVLLSVPVVHDAALISALDSLKAIQLSQRPLPVEARADAPPASSSLQ